MAHAQQLQFVKSVTRSLTDDYTQKNIIEIGSYDVNGSVRQFFKNSSYIGVDLIAGIGVDVVCEGDKVDHPDNIYDIALSCECFEHNPNWLETLENMHRMTKEGGVIVFTYATTGRKEHGTTRTAPKASPGTQALNWDYYRNLTQEDFEKEINLNELFSSFFFLTNERSHDLYFFGYKKNSIPKFSISTQELKAVCTSDQTELDELIMERKRREKYIPKPLRPIFRKFFSESDKFGKETNLLRHF
jgi:SAM-dependent methyltransferase